MVVSRVRLDRRQMSTDPVALPVKSSKPSGETIMLVTAESPFFTCTRRNRKLNEDISVGVCSAGSSMARYNKDYISQAAWHLLVQDIAP